MGRFETEWLVPQENLATLNDLSGVWVDRVHDRKKPNLLSLPAENRHYLGNVG